MIHENYQGQDMVLSEKQNIVLSPSYFDDLLLYKGQTLITTDGSTLLGADDKAGIAEIVTAMEHLIQHPEIKHGKIRVAFTPDEEIGRGAHKFDVNEFGAIGPIPWMAARWVNWSTRISMQREQKLAINGTIVHPGYAKGKMINSMLHRVRIHRETPQTRNPQETEGYEGFFHLQQINGEVEQTRMDYIIRDHDMNLFEKRKSQMMRVAEELNTKHGEKTVEIEIKDQYFNMREKVEPVMHIVDVARERHEGTGHRTHSKAHPGRY